MFFFFFSSRRRHTRYIGDWSSDVCSSDLPVQPMTVALTAYNDEDSIADAVEDFRRHRLVRRVIVVSNNSSDATVERAREIGRASCRERVEITEGDTSIQEKKR